MLNSGDTLSHYKIVSAIGAGGMGEVYLADDTKLGRQVALKILLGEFSDDHERVNRFVQEAKAASALNHPNILTVFEIGNADGAQYIATELIKGSTLRETIKREPPDLIGALDIALQITAALSTAHEAGIIHRDIKPENIMIRQDGLVKVLDFGLAKLLPNNAQSMETTLPHLNTKPGMIVGTVAYMSPEQARGRPIDARSDIFSLGILLFEIFAGKRPFDGESQLDLISSILKDDPPSLRQVIPSLPREIERIVDKTLRKDRDHRYQSIRDLHIDIEDLRDELKFEAKLNKTVQPTIERAIHETNQDSLFHTQSNLRSALATGISKTRRFTVLHALVFVALIGGLVTAVWYLRPQNVPAAAGIYKTSEVATWSAAPGELSSSAAFSPDGKLIAFTSTKSGSKAIWVTQTASTEAIQITNDSFANTDPVWSPKGDEVAYISRRPNASGGTTTGVWRVSALGGSPRAVGAVNDGTAELRKWTQSGKIYFELKPALYAMDIASGTSQKIISLDEQKPVWINVSSDEKSFAYAVSGSDKWQVFVSDVSRTNPKEIASGTGQLDPHLAWLPEKNRLFYSASTDSISQIFLTSIGSSTNIRIASPESDSNVVDASPDGRSLLLSSAKEESNIWRVGLSDGQETPVFRDLNAKLWPTVSPGNDRLVFQSIKNLSAGNKLLDGSLVVRPIRSTSDNERPTILSDKGFIPAWSPDGSTVAYLKVKSTEVELYSVNAEGGGEKRLAGGGIPRIGYSVSPYNQTQTRTISWSPDSTRIAYAAKRDGVSNIWVVGVRDGADTKLTSFNDSGTTLSCPIWSADGKRLAFYFQREGRDQNDKTVRGLRVFDLTSGSASDILESSEPIRLIGWAADEAGLIVAVPNKEFVGLPPETTLCRISIRDGSQTVLSTLKNAYFYNIFLSEDRKQIAFAAREQNLDDLWVIPATGGTARKLTSNNDSGQYYSRLAWTPDGFSIVYGKQVRFSLLSIIADID